MKVLVSSISQAAANRLKTPITGSFILSWIAVNHKILFTLFLSDNKERITLLNGLKFEWISDIALPIIVTLIYIFLVPAIQWLIDVVKFRFIDKKRTESQHSQLTSKYESLAMVSEKQSKSSLEYHNQRNLKDLEKWEEERTTLLGDITRLNTANHHEKELKEASELSLSKAKQKIDNLDTLKDASEQSIDNLNKQITILKSLVKDHSERVPKSTAILDDLSSKLEDKIFATRTMLSKLPEPSPLMNDKENIRAKSIYDSKKNELDEINHIVDCIDDVRNIIKGSTDIEMNHEVTDVDHLKWIDNDSNYSLAV